jgi:hypothetical protein
MGGKSCLAVTFPIPALPAPGQVNSGLTARDHISPRIRASGLEPVSGLFTRITANCGIPATLGIEIAVSNR